MRALILSTGLIGGSIAKALANAGWEIHATTRKPLQFEGINFHTEYDEIPMLEYDIICICSPRGKNYEIYKEMFELAHRFSTHNTFIIDVSSVQNQNNLFQLKYRNFVPCHPIAGSEKTGFENSSPEIVQGKKCLVIKKNPPKKVLDFWQACGMIVDNSITSCMEHDRIFAKISHLPQLISFNLPPEEKPEYTGFYRLKNSSQKIWDEIFLHNKDWIFEGLIEFARNDVQILSNEIFTNFEQMIGRCFLEITTEQEKKYGGNGFRTITSALSSDFTCNTKNINEHYDKVKEYIKILDDAAEMLSNLVLPTPDMKE
jgi:prephenate dehydrogenase